jgi:hypothetical protein
MALMLRAKRLRRVWAILIGMSALAVTVGVVTIMIHDRMNSEAALSRPANTR